MKQHLIVTTDFSDSSKNALDYTCSFAQHQGTITITLLFIHPVPFDFTPEGVALANTQNTFALGEEQLKDEILRVTEAFPGIDISHKAIIGNFSVSLKEQVEHLKATMVVLGSGDSFDSSFMSSRDMAGTIPSIPVPVLLVPPHVRYQTYKNIAFACDYKKSCIPSQVKQIKELSVLSETVLHVVHITRGANEDASVKERNEIYLQQALQELSPTYHAIESPDVITALEHFIKEKQVDLLIVIPRKHDFWFKLFHSSHTSRLAKMSHIPVLALHDE